MTDEDSRLVLPIRHTDGKVHVTALSGGKDSTCLALALKERNDAPPMNYVFTPTGDELPEMVEHWKRLKDFLGTIIPVSSGHSLNSLIDKWDALPNWRQRWCTRVLKIEPYYAWMLRHAPAVSYVGLRADEESRGGMEFPDVDGMVEVRFPFKEWGWGINDVLTFLGERDIAIPYRTDCARCYEQRLGEWWRLYKDHADIYQQAVEQERRIGHTFRSEKRDGWPAGLADLREHFEAGHVPQGTQRMDDLFGYRRICRTCTL